MKVLIVASYNKNRYAPFIVEQVETLRQNGCEIDWFGVQGKGLVGYLKAIPLLRAKIRVFQPDIVHAHYGLSCLLANLATRRVPIVGTYHGSDINVKSVRPFSRLAMWLSAWNIFVSKRNMALVRAVDGKKCSLIPCGVNLPMPWSELQKRNVEQLTLNQWVGSVLESNKKHVLFAGAFDNAVKDPELAMAAVAAVNSEKLRDSSAELELIELKGYTRDQVNALMCNCDAFLMTSKTEGSPQVIKEAMACGCPIVSVDVGDVKERVEGVEGCFVVPRIVKREEVIEELAKALKNVVAFAGRTKGRERIIDAELTNEQVAKRIIRIYEQILKREK